MTQFRIRGYGFAVLALIASVRAAGGETVQVDVVFYGGTAAGVIGAIQADRSGLETVLVSPARRLGGMTTGGLGATDFGSKTTVSGLAADFYHRVYEAYREPARWVHETRGEFVKRHRDTVSETLEMQWFFEPKVALEVLEKMLAETSVKVWKGVRLAPNGVGKSGPTISSLTLSDGRDLRAKVFVDTTYTGDLMAAAGVPYVTGREANKDYAETLNGIRVNDRKLIGEISPFIDAGDPSSGLLPLIERERPGHDGDADHRTQAFTYRLCLTDAKKNRLPIKKPDRYDPQRYELVARWIKAHPSASLGTSFFKLTPMPNRKTDSNNKGPFSTDFVGMSYDYADGDHDQRAALAGQHRDYIQGFLWFLGNDPRVPDALREEVARWGLPKDEFLENDGWPTELYVREWRRMRGAYVVTQHDAEGKSIAADPIGLASYAMDSHAVSQFVDEDGFLRVEGAFWRGVKPFGISYRAIVPQRKDCGNLLVPVCLSATHAAYGSIRMEPVFMMLSQAAAVSAAIAINDSRAVQAVPYDELRQSLDAAGLMYRWKPRAARRSMPRGPASGPSRPGSGADSLQEPSLLEQLQKAGVIEDTQPLRAIFEERQPCPPDLAGRLLLAAAQKIEPTTDVKTAVDVLADSRIIANASYWHARLDRGVPLPAQWIIDFSSKLLGLLSRL